MPVRFFILRVVLQSQVHLSQAPLQYRSWSAHIQVKPHWHINFSYLSSLNSIHSGIYNHINSSSKAVVPNLRKKLKEDRTLWRPLHRLRIDVAFGNSKFARLVSANSHPTQPLRHVAVHRDSSMMLVIRSNRHSVNFYEVGRPLPLSLPPPPPPPPRLVPSPWQIHHSSRNRRTTPPAETRSCRSARTHRGRITVRVSRPPLHPSRRRPRALALLRRPGHRRLDPRSRESPPQSCAVALPPPLPVGS
mmetsp:Transcript_17414/g.44339  ORF Transcript_17414/g.44339 Transcript_17414/m.44339 type:complete len:247 (+) Transcript_17414:300-1040(+)